MMSLKPILSAMAVFPALISIHPGRLFAQEPGSGKVSENLHEISRPHIKDPFLWPSIWKLVPQASDPGGMRRGTDADPNMKPAEPGPASASPADPSKKKLDWKASEERRTRAYLKKVGPLMASSNQPATRAMEPETPAMRSTGPVRHYLAQNIVLTTPFLAEPRSGAFFPGECKLKYSESNVSEILQLYDEVVLTVGRSSGAKPGDFYRTYQIGESYRSYAAGRNLGRLVETNGIVEIVRVGEKTSVARLVRCFGTISRDSRASPLGTPEEITATGYVQATDGKLAAQVVWVTQQQQFPQPYSYAIVDRGAGKGYRTGDMVLFLNRSGGRMTDKVLGNGIVVSVQERAATILIRDLLPGIINRGDYSVIIQSAVL